jgi:hypothetical protein
MNKRRKYEEEDGPSDFARVIPDFLPPPEKLFPPEYFQKITLRLDRPSIDFYKASAKRHGLKYQRLMREVLKRYALQHSPRRKAA